MNLPRAEAQDAGIMPVRGFALAGSQGTGKTEICKYAHASSSASCSFGLWEKARASFVGDSERTTRQVIQIARATHAFVMLDDIDKGGVAKGKDYTGDGGTSGNQIQMILTEASDPFSPIIWAFTFNRLPDLPSFSAPADWIAAFTWNAPTAPRVWGSFRRAPSAPSGLMTTSPSCDCWPTT